MEKHSSSLAINRIHFKSSTGCNIFWVTAVGCYHLKLKSIRRFITPKHLLTGKINDVQHRLCKAQSDQFTHGNQRVRAKLSQYVYHGKLIHYAPYGGNYTYQKLPRAISITDHPGRVRRSNKLPIPPLMLECCCNSFGGRILTAHYKFPLCMLNYHGLPCINITEYRVCY